MLMLLSFLCVAQDISIPGTGISFNAPNKFDKLPQEIIDVKWPKKNAPKWAIGNKTASTTIAYDLKPHDISNAPLNKLKESFVSLFNRMIPGISWKQTKIVTISGKKWLHLEMTSNAIDTDIYNIMLVTSYGKQMLTFNFNSTKSDFKNYETALRKSIGSIEIK